MPAASDEPMYCLVGGVPWSTLRELAGRSGRWTIGQPQGPTFVRSGPSLQAMSPRSFETGRNGMNVVSEGAPQKPTPSAAAEAWQSLLPPPPPGLGLSPPPGLEQRPGRHLPSLPAAHDKADAAALRLPRSTPPPPPPPPLSVLSLLGGATGTMPESALETMNFSGVAKPTGSPKEGGSPQEQPSQSPPAGQSHESGTCKPCLYFSSGLCHKGGACTFCHLSHDRKRIVGVRPSKRTRACLERRSRRVAQQGDGCDWDEASAAVEVSLQAACGGA
mmetsp:Transcript_135429/g.433135  ORF Transcript_135429/g.433135 Transcript_135429/m.433135 type:complete len:275 (-) Transcript_135429:106-930(-)|eukprot:CAMPEP_0203906418 /NCGR_PEP_ID=MMETSP0359-20131031/48042_1 /ASSEMBLY_ACC=CAM_ASM_000338 /TAXON_ID=268821 /ORGANISM="Scrippsiella Hangoei, Strain SHTV-5" /LENGTH=274 /DNA_ID=CAMNT_0050831051 /DNA_START=75 /DNA_END=899 /DNA_ORIENTATION=+